MKSEKNKYLHILTILVALIPLVSYGVLFTKFPESIPMHFNAAGEVDRYGDKYEVLLLAVLPIALMCLLEVLPKIDPKKENYKKFEPFYKIFSFIIVVFLSGVYGFTVYSAFQKEVMNISTIIFIGVGALFLILGNYMPQAKQNYLFGIRTPWTLANENVWIKTHRVGGYCFMGAGIGFVLVALVLPTAWITAAVLIITAIMVGIPPVYSYMAFKQEK